MLDEKFKEYRARQIAQARKAHGHIEGADDIDCLCLRISNICRLNSERVSTLNLNALQAQIISRLEREKGGLIKRLEGPGFDADYLTKNDQ